MISLVRAKICSKIETLYRSFRQKRFPFSFVEMGLTASGVSTRFTVMLLFAITGCVTSETDGDYLWKPGPWQECVFGECGAGGQQRRDLWCVHRAGWPTLHTHCNPHQRLAVTRQCFKACEQHRGFISWALGEWSVCQQEDPREPTCANPVGLQTRHLMCTYVNETKVALRHSVCEKFQGEKPATRKACVLSCPRDCVISEFGAWSSCDRCMAGHQSRTRRILVPPINGGKNCSGLLERRVCQKKEECQQSEKNDYPKYVLGEWRACKPLHKKKRKLYGRRASEPIGEQTRDIQCIQEDGSHIDVSQCQSKWHQHPHKRQPCLMPRDCQLAQWSEWRPMGSGFSKHALHRTRSVLVMPIGSGKPCPALEEVKNQTMGHRDGNSGMYVWRTGSWGHCVPQNEKETKCSSGKQYRIVLCTRGNDSRPVSDLACSDLPRPAILRQCELPCPRDCVTTPWSDWGECLPHRCHSNTEHPKKGHRFRRRLILQLPTPEGVQCPHLVEQQPCEYPACFAWRKTIDNRCEALDNITGCGVGYRKLELGCVNHRKELISKRICEEALDSSDEIALAHCRVPCPNDCVLSDWSVWSGCSRTCGEGKMAGLRTRTRSILAHAGPGGMKCPAKSGLLESERCPNQPCTYYHWRPQPWQPCTLPANQSCGRGVRSRVILCKKMGNDKYVSEKRCPEVDRPVLEENCTVACPEDCEVTPFSEWTPCPVTCLSDLSVEKFQYRRRSVLHEALHGGRACPETLAEEKPCVGLSVCPRYQWQLSAWGVCHIMHPRRKCGRGVKFRDITCVRNGKENVTNEFCYQHKGMAPDMFGACEIKCSQQCIFSDWSEFTTCSRNCGGDRKRKRSLLAGGFECLDNLTHPLEESLPCPCVTYSRRPIGPWFEIADQQECGTGKRSRVLMCVSDVNSNITAPARECGVQGVGVNLKAYHFIRYSFDKESGSIATDEENIYIGFSTQEKRGILMQITNDDKSKPEYISIELNNNGGVKVTFDVGWGREELNTPSYADLANGQLHVVHVWRSDKGHTVHIQVDDHPEVVRHWVHPETIDARLDNPKYIYLGNNDTNPFSGFSGCLYQPQFGSISPLKHMFQQQPHPGVLKLSHDNEIREAVCGADTISPAPGLTRLRATPSKITQLMATKFMPNVEFEEETFKVPCAVDYLLSPWSPWTSCNATTGRGVVTRSRHLIAKATGNGRQCPEAIRNDGKEVQQKACHELVYQWQAGQWGPCDLWDKTSQSDDIKTFQCGVGTQDRYVWCRFRNSSGFEKRVDDIFCDVRLKLTQTRKCQLPCPGECVISDWSPWTPCHRPCNISQSTIRIRRVIRQPTRRHGNCPHLEETASCEEGLHCQNVRLEWSKWGPCELDTGAICGLGVETQYLQCLQTDGTTVSVTGCQNSVSIEGATKRQRSCSVECPVDCVVSPWLQWSTCSQSCGHGHRVRHREVVLPAQAGGRECPQLVQRSPCVYTACYTWQVASWSQCHTQPHSCGYGEQKRHLVCTNHNGSIVPDFLCAGSYIPHVQTVRQCYVACPGDCVVSEWSTWGHCHRPCHPHITGGQQTRSRVVLLTNFGDGQPCPEDLIQSRNCTSDRCVYFSWHTSPWKQDKRTVWCQSSHGLKVIGGCSELNRPATVKRCRPPCNVSHSYCRDVNLCACSAPYTPRFQHGRLEACVMEHNATVLTGQSRVQPKIFPQDSWTNVWMYAVIAAGAAFIVFVAVALYIICFGQTKHSSAHSSIRYSTAASAMHRRSTMSTHVQSRQSRRSPHESSIEMPSSST